MNQHLWWYVARASGLVAWGLLTASMLWGFLTATRILGRRPRPSWVLDLHRFFGGLAVIFVAVHLLGLALDSYVEFTLPELFVPFVSEWRPLAMAWGITAFYLLLAIEITSLLKTRLPIRVWRWIHWLSYPVFGLSTVHAFQAGSDTRASFALIALAAGTTEVLVLLILRLTVPRGERASITPSSLPSPPSSLPSPPSSPPSSVRSPSEPAS